MSCPETIEFNVTNFRQWYPQFKNPDDFSDTVLSQYWWRATQYVSSSTFGWMSIEQRSYALNLMTAHLAALSVIIGNGQTPGILTSSTIDKISVTMEPPPQVNQWQWWLNSTPYGQEFLALMQSVSVGGVYLGGLPERSAIRQVDGIFPGGNGIFPFYY